MEELEKQLAKWVIKFLELDKFAYDTIEVTPEVIESICDLSADCHPKEFLAFLGGRVENKKLIIDKLLYQKYYAGTHSATPEMQLPTLAGCVGSIHSHPGPSNRPSDADLHFFDKNPGVHMIIKKPYRPEDICAYDSEGKKIEYTLKNHAIKNLKTSKNIQ
jgi:proteasome lid subunit RPN8/RPN11